VLFVDDRICAETMLSEWMLPFLDPAIRAIALPQETLGAGAADPRSRPMQPAAGPLIAGKSDRPTLVTKAVAFDYPAAPEELMPPAAFVEVPLEQLRDALGGYGF
jgi:hypothetical protein